VDRVAIDQLMIIFTPLGVSRNIITLILVFMSGMVSDLWGGSMRAKNICVAINATVEIRELSLRGLYPHVTAR
jgi:hypothetical protein